MGLSKREIGPCLGKRGTEADGAVGGQVLLATGRKRPTFLPNYGSALSSLFSNAAAAVAWFFLLGLPCVLSLDLAMEVKMMICVNLSMALHVVLRGKSVRQTTLAVGRS
jgi:hypothetical protein